MSEVLYLKIVADIRDKIIKSIYKPGDMLKSEAALMKEYAVGRMTIRRSIAMLANQGYVYSVPGKGSFVCTPENDALMMKFDKYNGYLVTIHQIKLLTVQVVTPSEKIRQALDLKLKEKIVTVKRLLISGNETVGYEWIHFPYRQKEPVVEDVLRFSNYMVELEERLAFALRKKMTFDCHFLTLEEKETLKTKENLLVRIVETIYNSELQKPVSYTILYIHPNYFSIDAESVKEENGTSQSY